MIDLDRYKEILDTLSRNKTRSFLTGFGVFWGIFMLVSLLGGGKGLRELLSSNFKGFANNSGVLITQNTTKPYDGLKKDRSWSLSYKDIERLKQQIPEVDVVTPLITKWGYTAVYGDQKVSCAFKGLDENYQEIETPELEKKCIKRFSLKAATLVVKKFVWGRCSLRLWAWIIIREQ